MLKNNKLKLLIILSTAVLGFSILIPIPSVLADVKTNNDTYEVNNTVKNNISGLAATKVTQTSIKTITTSTFKAEMAINNHQATTNALKNNEAQNQTKTTFNSLINKDDNKRTLVIPKFNNDYESNSSSIYENNNVLDNNSNNTNFDQLDKKLDNMSDAQIEQFIDKEIEKDKLENLYGNSKISTPEGDSVRGALALAWYAAAAIAKRRGYTCSGTLVQYCLANKNYNEYSRGGKLFAKKIRKNSDFLKAKKQHKKYFVFHRSHSRDLFYGLHKVSVNFHSTKKHPYHVWDKFNFDNLWGYRSFIAGFANNAGYLTQHIAHVFHSIKVNIYFR